MNATARYELRLTIDVPVHDGDDPRDYITQPEKSRIERGILRRWNLDGDIVDIEVIDASVIVEDENPRQKGDDDGHEYGDPRDVA